MCYFGLVCQLKSKTPFDKCDTCNSYQKNQQKEPLVPQDPPKRPWSHVAVHLLNFNNKKRFIIIDYWPDYLELNPQPTTNASTVIASLKSGLHAMAYRTCFIVTMVRSFHQDSSKNLHQIGNLTTSRHHPITPIVKWED